MAGHTERWIFVHVPLYITIHTRFYFTVAHDLGSIIEIELYIGVSNYRIDMQRVRISNTHYPKQHI